jgi:hypothetical protein
MKQQISTAHTEQRVCRQLVPAAVLCGLLGITPFVALAQDETPEGSLQHRSPTGVTTSTQNPLQIAILHWYSANQTTAFKVAAPGGVAFDGANMWMSNYENGSGGTVTKLRASDGAELGTFKVGNGPLAGC